MGIESLDHPNSVVTTLSLSFASVEQQSALAADVLRVCSLLHSGCHPGGASPPGSRPPGTSPGRHGADPLAFNNALSVIQSYSLLLRRSSEQTLSIRPARAGSACRRDDQTGARSMDRANHCCAQYGLSPSQGRGLGAMGTMRASLAARAHRCGGLPHWRRVWNWLLYCSDHSSFCSSAPNMSRLSHSICALCVSGSRRPHKSILRSPFFSTIWLSSITNRATTSEPSKLLQRALHLDEQMCGHEHRNTATRLNNLAVLYIEQGNHQRAEPLLRVPAYR